MAEIKHIIFDLGGVIINLDIPKTITEFNHFSKIPFESVYTQLQQNPVFDQFDKGQISESVFFDELNKAMQTAIPYQELRKAWDAMLLDFPAHRLQLLKDLKTRYKIFLLSNTNESHVETLEANLRQQHGYKNLEPFFEKVYYSCRMNMRKPDLEIFTTVLEENHLNPANTLFIDDSPQHVKGAIKAGINAHLLEKGKDVRTLLAELGLI